MYVQLIEVNLAKIETPLPEIFFDTDDRAEPRLVIPCLLGVAFPAQRADQKYVVACGCIHVGPLVINLQLSRPGDQAAMVLHIMPG